MQRDPYAVVWLDEYLDDPTEAGDAPSGLFCRERRPVWRHGRPVRLLPGCAPSSGSREREAPLADVDWTVEGLEHLTQAVRPARAPPRGRRPGGGALPLAWQAQVLDVAYRALGQYEQRLREQAKGNHAVIQVVNDMAQGESSRIVRAMRTLQR